MLPEAGNGSRNGSLVKAVILIGGPQKGTRFRPLSLDVPKPLFPVAGVPMVQHLIESCAQVPTLREILILGNFPSADIVPFLSEISPLYEKVRIRYLQEYTQLGTAGGVYHFRDQIKAGNPSSFVLINGDVCGDFPLQEMLEVHAKEKDRLITILATEATRQQSVNYGCIVENKDTHQITHYVEKPETFVSTLINCGVYICSLEIFPIIAKIFAQRQANYVFEGGDTNGEINEAIALEQDIIMPLAGSRGKIFAFPSNRMWSQVKTAASAIYANRQYLNFYRERQPQGLVGYQEQQKSCCNIVGDVHIHPTAQIHPSCVIGPNVSIGKNVVIGAGVRIRESIILGDSVIQDHSLLLHAIVGWNSFIGKWVRIEGTPCDPNPNKPFAKMDNVALFNDEGRLNPSITILGCHVRVPSEVVIINSIVLPHKELSRSFTNEIIL